MLKVAFQGRFRGSGLVAGNSCIPRGHVSTSAPGSNSFRALFVVMTGMILSGCVATVLTPTEDLLTPIVSLGQTDSGATNLPPDSDESVADTASSDQDSPEIANIPIPVHKPQSVDAPKQPAQLALTDKNKTSVAARNIEKLVVSKKQGNASQSPTDSTSIADSTQVANPANKGLFALLFENRETPASQERSPSAQKREKITTKKPAKKQKARKVAVFKPTSNGQLPGVRKLGLFGIYESREGADEGYGEPVLVASAGGLARLSPNGLRVQRAAVQVACIKPDLVRLIKTVQRRYGKVPIVTSGYRSPSYNRRVRGARNSMHIYCKAVDIQVEGVSKWALAKYMRTLPGRGGVGTYCRTNSVHIDTGTKRDWNWRCRRGKRKR